jgi:Flp pilus assembly protein TadG
MIAIQQRWAHFRAGRSLEGGYVAVLTALCLIVLMGLAAFAVDVGHWYLVGQQEQNAADAAAMAGVTSLPGNLPGAQTTALNYSKINGFQNGGVNNTTVTAVLGGSSTRLQVTVSEKVTNFFGSLLGVPTTNVSRTSIADYSGPVPLGSPCNEFGDDPSPLVGGSSVRSSNCSAAGSFWGNVGSGPALKSYGDAYQDNLCAAGVDGCSGSAAGPNTDYDTDGYFYSVTLTKAVSSLTIQAFDPALIDVGDYCGAPILPKPPSAPFNYPDDGDLTNAMTIPKADTVTGDPATRYATGTVLHYCTGDIRYGGTGDVATQFTVREAGPNTNAWDPMSFLPVSVSCTQTFAGFSGDLNQMLNTTTSAYKANNGVVAHEFRQWVTLCTIPSAQPGTYMIQVKTNKLGSEAADGHNRFSLRAYGGSSTDDDAISVSGFQKMAVYANISGGFVAKDYLAQIPSGAKGQTFNVSLFDVGDGASTNPISTIQILPPLETNPPTFAGCTGAGPTIGSGSLTNCQITVNSTYNGKWEVISVPIPSTYSCIDASITGCWVRLQFSYGAGSTANDTFSMTADIDGDPVRLVQ